MSERLVHFRSGSAALVVDAWPVMEWCKQREPAAGFFLSVLEAADRGDLRLLMSDINLGEVYYLAWKEWGEQKADELLQVMRRLPIQIVHASAASVMSAARLKGKYRISYADAFGATLAMDQNLALLTGDLDFGALEADGLLRVQWVGV